MPKPGSAPTPLSLTAAIPTDPVRDRLNDETLFAEGMKFMMTDEPTKALAQFEKLLKQRPNNAAAHYATAQALVKTGKVTEALPHATKAYELDKTNKYYTLQLSELYVKQKRYAEAEVLYENLLKLSNDNMEYGVELAAIYLFDDKPDKALDTYNRVEKALGLNEEITRQKQRIYLKQNKVDKAVEEAERLVAYEPGDPDYLIEGAELLMANDRDDQAIGWLDRALKLNTESPQAHVLLAEIYRKKGDMARARKELDYVFANPNLEAGLKARILSSYVGLSDNSPGSQQDALKLAQELAKTHPKDARSQIMLADLLAQQGKKAEARDLYAKAARLDGSTYEVWGALLQLDGELNQVDSLLVHSQQALELFPNQGLLWYSNGSANLYKRKYTEAVEALEESRKLLSNAPSAELEAMLKAVNAQLGDAYNGLGDHAKSDEAYENVLKADPKNDHVLNNYSYFLSLRNDKMPRALEMSTRLVQQNPNSATYLDTHAWVLYVMKDYAQARTFLEKALAADPNGVSGTIIEHYGDALFKLGEKDKAVEQWKRAKQKGETSQQLDKKIASGTL
ncbi:MAG: hypothetical protein EAZ91_01545 [Cytophagales bacterium]|nr:MAG: hypothetical protein EAZ91_01545 [Cytophagales bacterium]